MKCNCEVVTRDRIVAELNSALDMEHKHWNFYTNAAIRVTGLHREEFHEFFLKEAAGEAEHIQQFGKLIIGLGGSPVTHCQNPVVFAGSDVRYLLNIALVIEKEVVENYVNLMDLAENFEKINKVDGRYIHIFLEDQILDSRGAVDHIGQLLVNNGY